MAALWHERVSRYIGRRKDGDAIASTMGAHCLGAEVQVGSMQKVEVAKIKKKEQDSY